MSQPNRRLQQESRKPGKANAENFRRNKASAIYLFLYVVLLWIFFVPTRLWADEFCPADSRNLKTEVEAKKFRLEISEKFKSSATDEPKVLKNKLNSVLVKYVSSGMPFCNAEDSFLKKLDF